MKQTEESIIATCRQILADLEEDYIKSIPIVAHFYEKADPLMGLTRDAQWLTWAAVPEAQWDKPDETASIVIQYDDETGRPYSYADNSLGRPIIFGLKLNDAGRYERCKLEP